jgi:hypothetical protein
MGDAATADEAQNATLTAVLNSLWGEQRCGVDTATIPDVDIGPTAMHKWAATQLSKAGIGVAMDDPQQAATTASHSTVQLWMSESDMKGVVESKLADAKLPENEKIYGFSVVLERNHRWCLTLDAGASTVKRTRGECALSAPKQIFSHEAHEICLHDPKGGQDGQTTVANVQQFQLHVLFATEQPITIIKEDMPHCCTFKPILANNTDFTAKEVRVDASLVAYNGDYVQQVSCFA